MGQVPQLDLDGNGQPDAKVSTALAEFPVGQGLVQAADLPVITAETADQTLRAAQTLSLTAEITTTTELARVWATIREPDFYRPPDEPILALPQVELTREAGTDRWNADRAFNKRGIHQVAIFAEDTKGRIASPARVTITQTLGNGALNPGRFALERDTLALTEGGTAELAVVRTEGSEGVITVSYATADGSATAGSDYTAANGSLTFQAGETRKTLTLEGLTDEAGNEGLETFTLTLNAASGAASLGTPSRARVELSEAGPAEGRLDIDGNGRADALTDGLLVLRHLFGFTGTSLVDGAVAEDCTRCSAAAITEFLEAHAEALDIDGSGGAPDALTDGLLVLRYLFDFTGPALTEGAVDTDGCSRCAADGIATHLAELSGADADPSVAALAGGTLESAARGPKGSERPPGQGLRGWHYPQGDPAGSGRDGTAYRPTGGWARAGSYTDAGPVTALRTGDVTGDGRLELIAAASDQLLVFAGSVGHPPTRIALPGPLTGLILDGVSQPGPALIVAGLATQPPRIQVWNGAGQPVRAIRLDAAPRELTPLAPLDAERLLIGTRDAVLAYHWAEASVAWRKPLGARPVASLLEMDGDPAREVLITAGDRLHLLDDDGATRWQHGIVQAEPHLAVDLDGNGGPEIVGTEGNRLVRRALTTGRVVTRIPSETTSRPLVVDAPHGAGQRNLVLSAGGTLRRADLYDPQLRWLSATSDAGEAALASADLNGDARLELLVRDGRTLRLLAGDTLAEVGTIGTDHPITTALAADLNRDGRAELVIGHAGGVTVYTGVPAP